MEEYIEPSSRYLGCIASRRYSLVLPVFPWRLPALYLFSYNSVPGRSHTFPVPVNSKRFTTLLFDLIPLPNERTNYPSILSLAFTSESPRTELNIENAGEKQRAAVNVDFIKLHALDSSLFTEAYKEREFIYR